MKPVQKNVSGNTESNCTEQHYREQQAAVRRKERLCKERLCKRRQQEATQSNRHMEARFSTWMYLNVKAEENGDDSTDSLHGWEEGRQRSDTVGSDSGDVRSVPRSVATQNEARACDLSAATAQTKLQVKQTLCKEGHLNRASAQMRRIARDRTTR